MKLTDLKCTCIVRVSRFRHDYIYARMTGRIHAMAVKREEAGFRNGVDA